MLNRGETMKLTRAERRVHRSRRRFRSRTSRRRCWSSTSSRRTATPGCASCCAPTARASTPTRRSRRRWTPTSIRLQAGFDQMLERRFGALRRALADAGRGTESAADAARRAARRRGRATAQLSRCRWRSAARCARRGRLDEAMQAFERAAALVPMPPARTARTRRWRRSRCEKKDHRARDRRAARRGGHRFQQRRRRAPARRAAAARRTSTTPPSCGR